jgi:secretion/DNA translocation related CpaE-like protein
MGTARVIGIVGGHGGAGASVLTAALAVRAAAAGRSVVCVDAARLGGGLDVTMGLEQEPGLRWPELAGARGRVDGAELLNRLPTVDGVAVLSFDRVRACEPSAEAVSQVMSALTAATGLVLVDLPGPDEPLFPLFAAQAETLVLVCTDGLRAMAAASVVTALLATGHDDLWLCLRSSGRGRDLGESIATALDVPLLAEIRSEASLDADLVHGIPPASHARSALARAADLALARLLLGPAREAS